MGSQEQKGNMKLFIYSKKFCVANAMTSRKFETKALITFSEKTLKNLSRCLNAKIVPETLWDC